LDDDAELPDDEALDAPVLEEPLLELLLELLLEALPLDEASPETAR
jgi:hypothetical protein